MNCPASPHWKNALNRHMGACPVYMPKSFYTPESDLREVEEEHLVVYAAFDGDEPVAHLAVYPGGETFPDQNPASRHIGAAYCRPEYRGRGLIDALMNAAQRDLAAQGVPLLEQALCLLYPFLRPPPGRALRPA